MIDLGPPSFLCCRRIFTTMKAASFKTGTCVRLRSLSWLFSLSLSISACVVSLEVEAADYSISGYGTLGFAQTDKPYAYQRFVDDAGTFRRDSIAGVQIDAVFDGQIGATAQLRLSPASDNDAKYRATLAWAFLSYRPENDWLFRVGRQRIPLYLYSQNFDVGATYDFARLPTEMYSISPNNEMDGVSFSRTWSRADDEVVLDGFWGRSKSDVRIWLRDGIAGVQNAGSMFRRLEADGGGIALSYRQSDSTFRMSVSRVAIGERGGNSSIPTTFPFVSIAPGVGFYQVDPSLPGPGIPTIRKFDFTTLTLGANVNIGSDYRIISEFARTNVPETALSTQSTRGYASILKRIDKWTQYVTIAFLKSQSAPLDLHASVASTVVPPFVPNAALINAAQRIGADQVLAFDQRSLAIGTSYALSPTSKLKAELMHVRIGQVSSLVDAPPGSNIRNQGINVISLSYSVVF